MFQTTNQMNMWSDDILFVGFILIWHHLTYEGRAVNMPLQIDNHFEQMRITTFTRGRKALPTSFSNPFSDERPLVAIRHRMIYSIPTLQNHIKKIQEVIRSYTHHLQSYPIIRIYVLQIETCFLGAMMAKACSMLVLAIFQTSSARALWAWHFEWHTFKS